MNFGAGFYNDHHFHFGYHIYAAAVLSHFLPSWGRDSVNLERVLLLVRDIANPSDKDPFFPTFRHKDWYLGFSWASGILTIGGGPASGERPAAPLAPGGKPSSGIDATGGRGSGTGLRPYPNGRNQESSSEAVSAYEAVALYGAVIAEIFSLPAARGVEDGQAEGDGRGAIRGSGRDKSKGGREGQPASNNDNSVQDQDQHLSSNQMWRDRRALGLLICDVGRLLVSTELRAADMYWHVRPTTPFFNPALSSALSSPPPLSSPLPPPRIYPDTYQPRVVGMIWSMLVEEQTWFGNEAWKSYGIQLLPVTPISQDRDKRDWLREMIPFFAMSCFEKDKEKVLNLLRGTQNPSPSSPPTPCEQQGWSLLLLTSIAAIGGQDVAWRGALDLPLDAFAGAGGNGHSLTNTLWYISTRPSSPVGIDQTQAEISYEQYVEKVAILLEGNEILVV